MAQAVFDCSIPVISAVGHETDTTIIDYVADLRAPTPSAAAELAVYDVAQTFRKLQEREITLQRLLRNKIEWNRVRLKAFEAKIKMNSPMGKIREKKTWLLHQEEKLEAAMKAQVMEKRHKLDIYIEKLKGLSPLEKLNQGFSYVSDNKGKNVRDIRQVNVGESLQIYVKNGILRADVTGKEEYHGR